MPLRFERIEPVAPVTIRDGELYQYARAALGLEHELIAFRFTIAGVAETALVVLNRAALSAAVAWGSHYRELAVARTDTPDTVLARFARECQIAT